MYIIRRHLTIIHSNSLDASLGIYRLGVYHFTKSQLRPCIYITYMSLVYARCRLAIYLLDKGNILSVKCYLKVLTRQHHRGYILSNTQTCNNPRCINYPISCTCTGTEDIWMRQLRTCFFMDHSIYGPSQWETTLQCNIVCHWISR